MWTRERLMAHVSGGSSVKYLLFWGHTPKEPGRVDVSCLSQWFPRPFSDEGVDYATAEHFMMAAKARLFGDDEALDAILAAPSPAAAKAIGRGVRKYEEKAWADARVSAVIRGNVAKFGQNADLGEFLRATGDQVLVEASPRDTIWGIGLGASNPNARVPSKWRGLNLLGFALMEARERLFRPGHGVGGIPYTMREMSQRR